MASRFKLPFLVSRCLRGAAVVLFEQLTVISKVLSTESSTIYRPSVRMIFWKILMAVNCFYFVSLKTMFCCTLSLRILCWQCLLLNVFSLRDGQCSWFSLVPWALSSLISCCIFA